MQDPAYRAKSQGVMVFSLYLLDPYPTGGEIKFTTRDIGLVEAMRKECEVAKKTWSCPLLVYGTVTSFKGSTVPSIEMDKFEHRKASKVSFFLAMRSGIGWRERGGAACRTLACVFA